MRRIAEQAGFPNHKKKDSTGICFIGERRFRDFLARYLPANPGSIKTVDGEPVGDHQGLMYYTIGQRQGLGIGGVAKASEEPWFVIAKDLDRNVLVVAQGHDHPLLLRNRLTASQTHWIAGHTPGPRLECMARCRHRQALQACEVEIQNDKLTVVFNEPQRALTPGQSIVLYDNDVCLGGGVID